MAGLLVALLAALSVVLLVDPLVAMKAGLSAGSLVALWGVPLVAMMAVLSVDLKAVLSVVLLVDLLVALSAVLLAG